MNNSSLPYPTREKTMKAYADHLSRGKVEAFAELGIDIVIGRREGACFYDAYDNRRYLNCHCNGGVFNLGHRNPVVLESLRRALYDDEIDVGNHHLVSGWKALLASRLATTTNNHCPGVVFSPSGSEAVEVAIKTARVVTGRPEIISVHGGYHGHTGLAAMAGDANYHEPFGINLPDFTHLVHNDIVAMGKTISDNTAAVILETVPATLGIALPNEGYLARIEEICRERGALLILDEIQTGLGRSGKFWCYEHDGVNPDVVVTGKGLGGGIYPIAATLMTAAVHQFYDDEPFVQVSSYGGADIGCAIGLTVLDMVEAPGFLDRVEELGHRFEQKLSQLCEIRRRGLFIGLKWPDEGAGILAAKACIDAGVFAVFANNDTSVLQFLPPLTLTDAEADEIITLVIGALE